jgi:hypothetical protein
MKLSLMCVALFGNMPPPSYLVTLPPGREWVYEVAAWVFAALAMAASGLWFVRRRTLQPSSRRALLWLTAGSLAVVYSARWLWRHRDGGVVPPDLLASVAFGMPGVWAVGSAIVMLAGWRRVRGVRAGRGPTALAGRALGLAVVTLATGGLAGSLGFQLAFVVLFPGYLVAELGSATEYGPLLVLLGVNVVLWWAAWAFALWARDGFRANKGPAGPAAVADRGLDSE